MIGVLPYFSQVGGCQLRRKYCPMYNGVAQSAVQIKRKCMCMCWIICVLICMPCAVHVTCPLTIGGAGSFLGALPAPLHVISSTQTAIFRGDLALKV